MSMLSTPPPHVHAPPASPVHHDFAAIPTDCTVYPSPDDFPDWTDHVAVEAVSDPAADAWWLGFTLGLDGTPAVPPAEMSEAERAAFVSGHEIGHARFIEDCERDHAEAMERLDAAYSDPWDMLSEAEQVEAVGSVDARRIGGGV